MSILSSILKRFSGNRDYIVSDQLLYDKVIGFRGVVAGVGTSTIVQNTAIALTELTNYKVCVVDTAFMYPTQYPMLNNKKEESRKDFLDFDKELSDIVVKTNYPNITLVSMSMRNITDMLSLADSEETVERLFGVLKSYFDVILVDLSQELTNITTHSAVKCNRVFNVADQSLKSVYHLKKSINLMATLAVPIAKANVVIINKVLPDILTNTQAVLEGAGMKVITEIPHSIDIAKLGVTGSPIFSKKTTNRDVYAFSSSIITIVENLLSLTPKNANRLQKGRQLQETDSITEVSSTQSSSNSINSSVPTMVQNDESNLSDDTLEVDLFDDAVADEVVDEVAPTVAPVPLPTSDDLQVESLDELPEDAEDESVEDIVETDEKVR